MNLELDGALGLMHASRSQWARKVTEGWAERNLYCLACSSNQVLAHKTNWAVEDYQCPCCDRRIQLKAKNGRVGSTVSNSAYGKKRDAIESGRAPDYCFMGYNRDELLVRDLTWVPGHFLTLSVVSKRPPLRTTARRAGWVGSNIHLNRIPESGKIAVIRNGVARPRQDVRHDFAKLAFVQRLDAEARGWLTDVLACVDDVANQPRSQFTNDDVYAFEGRLASLYPENHNIRPKVRQQLQVLQAQGVVRRLAPGRYERL